MENRRVQPGLPRRAEQGIPKGAVPLDRTPRVPPNGTPYVPPPSPEKMAQLLGTTAPPPREERTITDDEGVSLGSEYERVDLPSNFALYEWQDLAVKRITPMDHAKIVRATRSKSLSVMLDVMSSTCNRDVRDFAIEDFAALCYWHKVNSYPIGTTNVTWNSRYGGRATDSVKKTLLESRTLAKTRADYLAWSDKGFACPTMRDAETLDTLNDEDTTTLFQRAEFINPEQLAERIRQLRAKGDTIPSVTARIEELNRRGMAVYELIDQFAAEFAEFGISETCEVTNTKWDPEKFADYVLDVENEVVDEDLIAEAHEIRNIIEQGGTPRPRKEKVPLTFNLWTMFSYV